MAGIEPASGGGRHRIFYERSRPFSLACGVHDRQRRTTGQPPAPESASFARLAASRAAPRLCHARHHLRPGNGVGGRRLTQRRFCLPQPPLRGQRHGSHFSLGGTYCFALILRVRRLSARNPGLRLLRRSLSSPSCASIITWDSSEKH